MPDLEHGVDGRRTPFLAPGESTQRLDLKTLSEASIRDVFWNGDRLEAGGIVRGPSGLTNAPVGHDGQAGASLVT